MIKQSANVTYAIVAMLATVLVRAILAVSAYLPLPRRKSRGPELRTPPESIAAAMALLAGSKLVQELQEGVVCASQSQIWSRKFRAGRRDVDAPFRPYDVDESEPEVADDRNGRTWRWGIEFVD